MTTGHGKIQTLNQELVEEEVRPQRAKTEVHQPNVKENLHVKYMHLLYLV